MQLLLLPRSAASRCCCYLLQQCPAAAAYACGVPLLPANTMCCPSLVFASGASRCCHCCLKGQHRAAAAAYWSSMPLAVLLPPKGSIVPLPVHAGIQHPTVVASAARKRNSCSCLQAQQSAALCCPQVRHPTLATAALKCNSPLPPTLCRCLQLCNPVALSAGNNASSMRRWVPPRRSREAWPKHVTCPLSPCGGPAQESGFKCWAGTLHHHCQADAEIAVERGSGRGGPPRERRHKEHRRSGRQNAATRRRTRIDA